MEQFVGARLDLVLGQLDPDERAATEAHLDGCPDCRAEAEALAKPAEREEQRRGDADRAVGGQRPDGDRRHAHRHERGDQRRLTADPIAEVAEERGADRSRQEGDRKGRERGERRGCRIRLRKKQAGKDEHRCRGVDVEVEELDGGADQARKQHLAGAVEGPDGRGGRCPLHHGRSPSR